MPSVRNQTMYMYTYECEGCSWCADSQLIIDGIIPNAAIVVSAMVNDQLQDFE